MTRAILFAGALLLIGCSDTPRTNDHEMSPPPPDLSVLFDFSTNADFAAAPDLTAPADFATNDLAVADLPAPDAGRPNDAATDGSAPKDGSIDPTDSGGSRADGGAPDMALPKSDLEINYCVIQFPKSAVATANAPSDPIYGQVFQSGLTDATMDKPAPGIIAELGIGPFGSDARASNAWTWIIAAPTQNYDWKKNNDEYFAALPGMTPGLYSYAFRFSVSGGAGYTYCDTVGNGGNNGLPAFDPQKTGQLTVK